MNKIKYPFNPILGSEEKVLTQDPKTGALYFTTDTRKIYLDVDDNHKKVPMGGNIGLFYGKMVLTSPPADGQTEFAFSIDDIVRNDENSTLLIPNVNDLILNSDGCFYKVLEVFGSGYDTTLSTEKLTIAGTGGGGGGSSDGPSGSLAGATMSRLYLPNGGATLYQTACPVQFAVKVTDDLGDIQTGSVGTYTVYINGIKQDALSGSAIGTTAEDPTSVLNITNSNEINTIDVGPYLPLGDSVEIKISVQTIYGLKTRATTIAVTNMVLTWDYDETKVNPWNNSEKSLALEWEVTGNVDKTTHIIINDTHHIKLPSQRKNDWFYELKYEDWNLWHDAHKIEMYATANIGGETVSTPSIYKNIIIAKENDNSTIISCSFFDKNIIQYNTIEIPIIIYNPNKSLTNVVTLIENNSVKDIWENVQNKEVNTWSYTPMDEGTAVLTIQSGGVEKSLVLIIEALDIEINEATNFTLKFKANEFSSNINVQNWNSKGYSAQFTSIDGDPDRFDWTNGGLRTDDNSRKYFCIKAGSKMTINYPLFYKDAQQYGKCFKFIFKATKCKDYDGQVLKCHDGSTGLVMRAQNATFNYSGKEIVTPYCEDAYMEYELDISNGSTQYIKTWLDGVPAGFKTYTNETLQTNDNVFIEIGSKDCDVHIYLIKIYESHLSDLKHLDNFIADAPNASEMVARYNRNDILDKDTNEISYSLLAQKNPNCFVHLYEMNRMTKTKKDPVEGCTYAQFHGSKNAVLNASNVTVKVQGTSSAAYGLAAFNLDSEFNDGFEDNLSQKHLDKWSMSPTAIPINYFCTKVNVASVEGSNNAVNQEWYNRYQPYQTVLRGKKKGAYNTGRDCMEFIPGVVFIKDNNPVTNDEQYGGHGDNVFKDTLGYCDVVDPATKLLTSSYYKMYSIGCMGNSKDNVEVFHDIENPFECCVENGDNQLPGQKMIDIQGGYSLNDTFYPVSIPNINKGETTMCPDGIERDNRDLWETAMDEIYGFRYPDGIKEVKKKDPLYAERMINGWYEFIRWMVTRNPQPAYERAYFTDGYYYKAFANEEAFNNYPDTKYSYDKEAQEYKAETKYDSKVEYYVEMTAEEAFANRTKDVFQWKDAEHTDYVLVPMDAVLDTQHNGTDESHAYFVKTAHAYGATNKKLDTPFVMNGYTFTGYKAPDKIRATRDPNSEIIAEPNLSQYQKNYEPVLKGLTINTYNGTYTHDTFNYRMAKMLLECEQYLCMDSIVYHYLFIERHSMVDNVAKNTFWSTEDGFVWNLTKNYDNDTADGNDNQGKLSLRYGYEPGDLDDAGDSIFNAPGSVWLVFIGGLYDACATMYQYLDNKGAWSPTNYLQLHKDFQDAIPERCWIEDHYRKYVRPLEVYNSRMFIEMSEGGKKTHQRAQYETYQNYYISSKYFGSTCQSNNFVIRGESDDLKNVKIPIQLYADCYVKGAYGSGKDRPNLNMRCKRNEDILIESPIMDATDATIYLWPSNLYQQLGNEENGLNEYKMTQFESVGAKKLRTMALGVFGKAQNTTLTQISFNANENLEKVYVAEYLEAEDLDLTGSTGLEKIDARNSGFSVVALPENAPLTTIYLNNPTTLTMSKLSNVENWKMDNSKLETIRLKDIDRNPSADLNSKILIETAPHLTRYRLEDVIWTETDPNNINVTDGTIAILEKLLPLNTTDNLDRKDALTGNLTITDTAFTGTSEEALKIYETYAKAKEEYIRALYDNAESFAKDNRTKYTLENGVYTEATSWLATKTYYVQDLVAAYPNLNITFESDTVTLYDVNIYDGDGRVQWKRKILPNETITEDFLKYGPNGSFSSTNIQKSPTAEYEHVFLKEWTIEDDMGQEIATLKSAEPTYAMPIQGNIHMHPQFETRKRSYTVSIKQKHPSSGETTILKEGSYEYGTSLSEVISMDTIPYVDSSELGLYEIYDFKGYSEVEGSSTLVPSNFVVRGETTLWAVFKLENDVRKVIHEEWFDYAQYTYDKDKSFQDSEDIPEDVRADLFADKQAKTELGLVIQPKEGIVLNGKITIPAFHNDQPIIKISNKFAQGQNITHVFCAQDSKLYEIGAKAFREPSDPHPLHYFDFTQNTVRFIDSQAFQSCKNLSPEIELSTNLFYIGEEAFNGALNGNGGIFTIPGNISLIGPSGFTYLNFKGIIQLGTEEFPSKLYAPYPDCEEDGGLKKFHQNLPTANSNAGPDAIIFRSKRYGSLEDEIEDSTGKKGQINHLFSANTPTITVDKEGF